MVCVIGIWLRAKGNRFGYHFAGSVFAFQSRLLLIDFMPRFDHSPFTHCLACRQLPELVVLSFNRAFSLSFVLLSSKVVHFNFVNTCTESSRLVLYHFWFDQKQLFFRKGNHATICHGPLCPQVYLTNTHRHRAMGDSFQ